MLAENERRLVARLVGLFSSHKLRLLIVCCCLIVVAIISLMLPLINKRLVDDGVMVSNFKVVVYLSLYILSLSIINSIVDTIKEVVMANVYAGIQRKLFFDAIRSLLHIEMSYFNTRNSSEIYSNLEIDVLKISSVCDSNVIFVVTQLLSLVGGLAGLFIIDYRLTMLVLVFFPFKVLAIAMLSRYKKTIFNKMLDAHSKFAHWFGDRIEGMKDIRLFGMRLNTLNEASDTILTLTSQEKQVAILDGVNIAIDSLLVKLLETALYIVGAYFIFDSTLSVGSLFAFVTYSINVMNPLSAVLGVHYLLAGVYPSADRYFSFMDEARSKQEARGGEAISQIETIEFRNVSFAYKENQVFRGVSFEVNPGEHVAIIGKNGAGKTTLFNLIQGFGTQDSGDVLVNGKPVSEYDVDQYRAAFSCINQNNHLFDMSVIDNITLFNDYSTEEITKIIKQSDLQLVLDVCRNSVGLNGKHLSGGQRQRVLFARVLFKDKRLFLFDEATASLDTESEKMIMDSFTTFLKEKTIISIIHDMSLLRYMDKIVELDGFGGVNVYDSYEQFCRKNQDNHP